MNYKTYAEAKIANPDSEIVTTGKNWAYGDKRKGLFELLRFYSDVADHKLSDEAWVVCNPADYCMTLEAFIGHGFKLVVGDKIITIGGDILEIKNKNTGYNDNCKDDHKRYILSAAALNGGCKIPASSEQWTIYNNTLPLCELTDEQAAMLFNAWRGGSNMQYLNEDEEWKDYNSGFYPLDTYRIKPKSERELFIERTTKVMRDAGTKFPDNHEYFGIMFDAGARYKDLTQHFGENI